MKATKDSRIALIKTTTAQHDQYWKDQQSELIRYRNIYESQFWKGQDLKGNMVRVETPDAHAFIEGYISGLFSKAPAIELSPDITTDGDPMVARALTNRFLTSQRVAFENASRLALLFPCAFLKLASRDSANVLDGVGLRAVPPWEILVDRDATAWEDQRFVGHRYTLSLQEAKARFGDKKFTTTTKEDFFTPHKRANVDILPEEYQYIVVVEMYDLLADELIFWSPHYQSGEGILEKEQIPVRTHDDRPLPPIIPLYYTRKPDRPLDGISAMARMYDLFYEKNLRRTYWASAVRKDARQWLVKRGALDEEGLATLEAGEDGAVIQVDEELAGLIQNIPSAPISSNDTAYMNYIEGDLAKGSMIAPFARGEASNVTATEITALAQYTASELGKYARERDAAIEQVAYLYLRIMSFFIGNDTTEAIKIGDKAKVVSLKDLEGKWNIRALDQGNDPITRAIKGKQLLELAPQLITLGADKAKILEAIVAAYDLPKELIPPAVEVPPTEEPITNPTASQLGLDSTAPAMPGLPPVMPTR